MLQKIAVERSESGYPLKFCLKGKWHDVLSIEDCWYGAGYIYYRVFTDNCLTLIVRYEHLGDSWSMYRKKGSDVQPDCGPWQSDCILH